MHTILGIDPGKKGAVVGVAQACGRVLIMKALPSEPKAFAELIREVLGWGYVGGTVAVLERASAMPVEGRKQGAAGMFNYGRGFGHLEAVLDTLGVPTMLVHPRTWTKELHAGSALSEPKARSLEAARKLYPGLNLVPPRCKVPHSGIVDALLMAEWGRRHYGAKA